MGAAAYSHMRVAGMRWAETTARTYRETNNRIEPGREDELAAVIRRYTLSDVVFSSALHGCVIALAMGRPVIAVSGDRKIEAFMTAAGLGDWVLCRGDLDRLIPLLDIINRQPPVEAFVDDAIGANRDVARAVTRMAAAIGASPRTPTVLR